MKPLIEHERAIIAAALLKSIPEIFTISPDEFYSREYRAAFSAIHKLHRAGKEISLITVSAELPEDSRPWLVSHFAGTFIDPAIKTIINDFKRSSRRRKYCDLISDISDKMREDSTVEDAITVYDKRVKEILKDSDPRARIFGDDGLGFERFQRQFIPTGVLFIDEIIRGFVDTQFIVIAARPGQGKSALALEIARHLALNKTVLFFSLEMEFSEIEIRLLTMESMLEMDQIMSGKLSDDEQAKFFNAEKRVFNKSKNLKIIDNVFYIEDIKAEAQRESLTGDLGAVFIDYLQLCKTHVKAERRVQVDEISRECKLLAKELRVPVIAVAQLSRLAENEEPKLSHLRESGAIEQDANIVMFLYQDEEQTGGDIVKFIIAKNRQGKTGARDIWFRKRFLEFKALVNNPENYQEIGGTKWKD